MLVSLLMSGGELGSGELFELPFDRHHGCPRVETGELRQTDLGQRAPDRGVESLPRAANTAAVFQATISAADGTIRECEGSFQGVEYGRGADVVRRPGQLVTAVRSAGRIEQAGPMQLLQQLGDRRRR